MNQTDLIPTPAQRARFYRPIHSPTELRLAAEKRAREARQKQAARDYIQREAERKKQEIISKRDRALRIFEQNLRDKRRAKFDKSWRNMISLASRQRAEEAAREAEEIDFEGWRTGEQILNETAFKYKVPVLDIKSRRRDKKITVPRFEFIWRARRETTLSYPQIGRIIGGRDHTTCIHGHRTYNKYINSSDFELRRRNIDPGLILGRNIMAKTGSSLEFDAFWEAFADKRGKEGALRVWNRKKLDSKADEVIAGALAYVKHRGDNQRFWKMAQGWLNDGRWMDEYPQSNVVRFDDYKKPNGQAEIEALAELATTKE